MKDFKKMRVWQDAIELAFHVYDETENFPHREIYGLVSQLRPCAVSIPSNIAEGSGRHTDIEKARFYDIALSSSYELETQLVLAKKFGFTKAENQLLNEYLEKTQRGLGALVKYLRNLQN